MYTLSPPSANAALRTPSSSWASFDRRSRRPLNVAGSPSAGLNTSKRWSASAAAMLRHLRPVGKPAPPRPRRPERSTTSIVAAGPSSWARANPSPPISVARYSSRVATGDGVSSGASTSSGTRARDEEVVVDDEIRRQHPVAVGAEQHEQAIARCRHDHAGSELGVLDVL